MRVCVVDQQGIGAALGSLLLAGGAKLVTRPGDAEVLLVDYPQGWGGDKLELARLCQQKGMLVCETPHGGRLVLQYDGLTLPCPYVDYMLVPAAGHDEVYRRMGFPVPRVVVGWFFCDLGMFTPPARAESLLFAPMHPFSGDGGNTLPAEWQTVNREVLRAFVQLKARPKRIRAFGSWQANFGVVNVIRCDDVQKAELSLPHAVAAIDQADVVVADCCTFGYLSVARGKPTVMFGQDIEPADDLITRHVDNWAAYREFMRYPFAFEDGPLEELVEAACVGGPDLHRWKTDFIGEQTRPDKLVATLEGLLALKREEQQRKKEAKRSGTNRRRRQHARRGS